MSRYLSGKTSLASCRGGGRDDEVVNFLDLDDDRRRQRRGGWTRREGGLEGGGARPSRGSDQNQRSERVKKHDEVGFGQVVVDEEGGVDPGPWCRMWDDPELETE